ncbi:hypothetical protein VTK26DRAFT_6915 [Humicola hyalothermophila]
MCSTDIFLGLLAVLFPPLPVWVKRGICSVDSLINILLFILGYVPGLLHSWYIIAKYPDPPFDYDYQGIPHDSEHGRIYVFVHGGGPSPQGYQGQPPLQPQSAPHPYGHSQQAKPQPPQPQPQQQHHNNLNYGTAGPASPPQSHHHQYPPQEQGTTEAGPSGGDGGPPPPSYAQVVAGDHKVQTHD